MQTPSPHDSDRYEPSLLWETLRASGDIRQFQADDMAHIARELEEALTRGGSSEALECAVSREQIETLVLPLAVAALELARTARPRVLVGITGGAGTGKTVLSDLLRRAINAISQQKVAVSLAADAYHFPNAFLDTQVTITDGIEHPLRQIKGLPPTFDVRTMVDDLRRLRLSGEPAIQLPVYDRKRHEPVPGSLCVQPQHCIIIVEGLHLLRPEPEWKAVRNCLDFCVLLDLPLETCRRRVTARKLATGRST